MKKGSKIAQWIFTGLFGVCALGNGLHWSSLFLVLAAVLMAPIPAIRDWLKNIKIKNWLAITLAVVIFFVGMMASPTSEQPSDIDSGGSSYSESQTEETNSSTTDNKDTTADSTIGSTDTSNTESTDTNTTSQPTESSNPETNKPTWKRKEKKGK